jgi:hypothetical protein
LQEAAAAMLEPHAFVAFAIKENSDGLVPVKVLPVILNAELPVLVSVVAKDLVRPLFTEPKSKLAGTIFTVPLVNVIVAPTDLVVSVTEVAVSVTAVGFGKVAGAAYLVGVPLAVLARVIVPQPEHEAAFWVMVQVTPPFAGSFRTVGVKSWVMLSGMIAETGETEITMASTVTVTKPDFVGSDLEVAVIVTATFAVGGVDGAVYVTSVLVGLLRVPPPDAGKVIFQDVGSTP